MNTQTKEMTAEQAVAIIGATGLRDGSIDLAVVERGAQLMASGKKLGIEAFAIFAMHLDPDSPHSPVYHKYAHEHFTAEDWKMIAHSARIGTPMRELAQDSDLREQSSQVRSGRTLPSRYCRLISNFSPGTQGEPSDLLKAAMAKLESV